MKLTTSASTTTSTPSKVGRRSGVQKKAVGKNPERSRRSKKSTTDSESRALARAREIKAKLSKEHPSFIKSIGERSCVGQGLPKRFCEVHLPKADTMIVLEDESGGEYQTKYVAGKRFLGSGWKGFCSDHNLVKGDALVFHLIQPSRFKVYTSVKSHGSNEMDGALGLLRLDGSRQQDSDVVPQENSPGTSNTCDANIAPPDQPENTGDQEENSGLQVVNRNRLMRSTTTFEEVTNIDNFNIVVNGLILDSQLPQHIKIKYYELCCSQQMFLHEHLLEGQNNQLVVGMICETVNVAEAIKASKLTTPPDSFHMWHRKLKGLEMWGMNVSFLLVRLERLMHLAAKTEEYKEVRNRQERAEEEKKHIELKLEGLKEIIRRLDGEMESLNQNFNMLEVEFQRLTNAPW